MNQTMKRVIGVLSIGLVVFVNFSNTICVFAEVNNVIDENSQEPYEYFQQAGPILEYFGHDIEKTYCSQILDVISDENIDQKAFFLFDKEDIIGLMEITETEIGQMYTFIYDSFDGLGENINNGESIALVNVDEQLVCVTDDTVEILAGDENANNQTTLDNISNFMTEQDVEQIEIEKEKVPDDVEYEISNIYGIKEDIGAETNSDTSQWGNVVVGGSFANDRYHTSYYVLGVPYVSNDKSDLGKGLCWAAAGASISNYLKKSNYTAKSIYNNLKKTYNSEPAGYNNWEKRMFEQLKLKYNFYTRKLSYAEIVNNLKRNKPMLIHVSAYSNGSTSSCHAIVLCGTFLSLTDNRYYYVYRDSNVKGVVVNSIIESTRTTASGNTFYYRDGGSDMYNNWDLTFVVYK